MLATVPVLETLEESFDKALAPVHVLGKAFGRLHCKGLPLPPGDEPALRGKENLEAVLHCYVMNSRREIPGQEIRRNLNSVSVKAPGKQVVGEVQARSHA